MQLTDRILLTGASGMVGRALLKLLRSRGFQDVLAPTRQELDLEDREQVRQYFRLNRPSSVLMIAAKVGGIAANAAHPVEFLTVNAHITLNLFEACAGFGTRRNLFLGSSCIYPRDCPQPMKEEYLLTGPLEPTNEAYALAKIVGLRLAEYYHRQFGMLTLTPMPCNVYGTGDSFDLQRSHVLSALVRRFVDAADARLEELTLWGTGSARREFIHVDDLAEALLLLLERYDSPDIINVGTGTDVTIRELAELIASEVGFRGVVRWDPSKPDGMPRKCLDTSRLTRFGFRPTIGLTEGIRQTVREYRHLKVQGLHP